MNQLNDRLATQASRVVTVPHSVHNTEEEGSKPKLSTQLAAALAIRCCLHPNRAQREQLKRDLRTFLTGLARVHHHEMVVKAWALDEPVPRYFLILWWEDETHQRTRSFIYGVITIVLLGPASPHTFMQKMENMALQFFICMNKLKRNICDLCMNGNIYI